MPANKPPYYHIFLLTVWQERDRGPPPSPTVWRFRLEYPRTGWQQVFVDVETLMRMLRTIAAGNEIATAEVDEEQGETK